MGNYKTICFVIAMIISNFTPCVQCCPSISDDARIVAVAMPLQSQYCFVNECTIKVKESNVTLNIINKTEDWIIAIDSINTTNLFTASANGTSCSSDNNIAPDLPLYVAIVIIQTLALIAAIANITLHLFFKELRTISGILIMIQCFFLSLTLLGGIAINIFYYHHIHIPANWCAFVWYFVVSTILFYETSKLAVLVHFTYAMYRSYRLLESFKNKRMLLCKYLIFITGVGIASSSIVIFVDLFVSRSAFVITDGQCMGFFFHDTSGKENLLSTILLLLEHGIYIILEISVTVIGLVLYFLNNGKQCCVVSTSKDFRISVVLLSTVGLNLTVLLILEFLGISSRVGLVYASAGTVLEQVAIFVIFVTSSKVIDKCCRMRGSRSPIIKKNQVSDI